MAIFSYVLKWIKGIGFVFILFLFLYVLTSIIYYSSDAKEKDEYIEKYNVEEIEITYLINREYIQIEVELKEDVSNECLVAYVFTYYDKYGKEVYMYVRDNNLLVSVTKNEIGLIKEKNNYF